MPPYWRDVRHALKHKREKITLFDLGQHIIFESSIGIQENLKDENPNVGTIKMVVEGKPSHSGKSASFKGKATNSNAGEKHVWNVASLDTKRKIASF